MMDKKKRIEEFEGETLGFTVCDAPIWLCKALSEESKEYHNNKYWPTVVDWYRKAKAYESMHENLTVQMMPIEQEQIEEIEDSTNSTEEVSLLGGHKGRR